MCCCTQSSCQSGLYLGHLVGRLVSRAEGSQAGNLRLPLALPTPFELHNVGEIQLSPVISGSRVIHHFY